MSRVSRAGAQGILAAYRDGITVICELAAQFTEAAWLAATPCAEWRAADLAGHLRCVADDYHEYLDDAPASRLARLMSTDAPAESLARKLARQNSAELAALPDVSGPEHIKAFAESARSYGRRLPLSWDLPHHRYQGTWPGRSGRTTVRPTPSWCWPRGGRACPSCGRRPRTAPGTRTIPGPSC
jgi:mycothiol maleylpyruvate isomerase-like protein